jgi:hypothetical protein
MLVAAGLSAVRTTEELHSLYTFRPHLRDNRRSTRVLHPTSATTMICG